MINLVHDLSRSQYRSLLTSNFDLPTLNAQLINLNDTTDVLCYSSFNHEGLILTLKQYNDPSTIVADELNAAIRVKNDIQYYLSNRHVRPYTEYKVASYIEHILFGIDMAYRHLTVHNPTTEIASMLLNYTHFRTLTPFEIFQPFNLSWFISRADYYKSPTCPTCKHSSDRLFIPVHVLRKQQLNSFDDISFGGYMICQHCGHLEKKDIEDNNAHNDGNTITHSDVDNDESNHTFNDEKDDIHIALTNDENINSPFISTSPFSRYDV